MPWNIRSVNSWRKQLRRGFKNEKLKAMKEEEKGAGGIEAKRE